jgi:hypothetical protein
VFQPRSNSYVQVRKMSIWANMLSCTILNFALLFVLLWKSFNSHKVNRHKSILLSVLGPLHYLLVHQMGIFIGMSSFVEELLDMEGSVFIFIWWNDWKYSLYKIKLYKCCMKLWACTCLLQIVVILPIGRSAICHFHEKCLFWKVFYTCIFLVIGIVINYEYMEWNPWCMHNWFFFIAANFTIIRKWFHICMIIPKTPCTGWKWHLMIQTSLSSCNSNLFPGGSRFESWPEHRLFWIIFMIFFSPSKQMPI